MKKNKGITSGGYAFMIEFKAISDWNMFALGGLSRYKNCREQFSRWHFRTICLL